ncbi:cysteine proteinase [Epithele typhae]|uniref:cysteine proteinase n=1 Tax=Epithele typhae TaxID=378194 RepID=UPI002007B30F|nr:cysteine proteinase [Epithele typhae]KAH9943232.1 cysteine proteinase [Epithele typhae]
MLASPLLPSARFADETSYRPAKDLDAFNKLLPPPIEFIEGSSSGVLAVAEGKYEPINEVPKQVDGPAKEPKPAPSPIPQSHTGLSQDSPRLPKTLYTGPIDTQWPYGFAMAGGLNNTGNTCFLNSALQCLLHTPPLLNIALKHSQQGNPCGCPKSHHCMICAFRYLMMDAHSKKFSTTPNLIISKLSMIAKHMRRGRQEDSHEFLRYFVDSLQRSTLAAVPQKVDQKLAEKTWVYGIFGGMLRSRVKCLSCGYNSDTYDRMMDLSVDIAGVGTLRDALRMFTAVDHLKGANRYKCEKCKKLVNADKQFTVHEAPLVLTIHLKRFSPMGRKIGHPVRYEERISLDSLMSDSQFGPSYSLYGIISHAGGGPNSGHYYAHVKSAGGQWYEMNDDSVSRHAGPPTGLKNAYVLFYMRDKGQALEAAVNITPSTSAHTLKPGLVANMKKRKASEGGPDGESSSPPKKPFIGPVFPSHPQSPKKALPDEVHPSTEALKKKIEGHKAQQETKTLAALVDYADNSDDENDVGEKVNPADGMDDGTPPVNPPAPPTSPPPTSAGVAPPAPPSPVPSSANPPPKAASEIPPSSFYGTSTPALKFNSRKRKTPDGDDEAASVRSPNPSSRPPKQRFSVASPFGRLTGSNNLDQRRDSGGPPKNHGRRRRVFGI